MQITITGYSTALFSTWIFLEEFGVLFDAGDGLSAGLLQKAGKVKYVFISHPDRDHLTGLFQFNQLNARKGWPIIHYPKDSGSFPALKAFSTKFDPHVAGTVWQPVSNEQEIQMGKDLVVKAIRNGHVVAPEEVTKSLSYSLSGTKRKLKPAFHGLSGNEIRNLIGRHGDDHVTDLITENIVGYSADTPVEDYARWDGTNILIHEATFLGNEGDRHINPHGNKHSQLSEVMEMVANIKVEKLILNHFSPRYSDEQIDYEIKKWIQFYGIKIPVRRILPGRIHRNILAEKPVN